MTEELNYTVHVREFCENIDLKPMDLVRIGNIAVGTAYRMWNGEPVTLDTIWRLFIGMRQSGIQVKFSNLVTIPDE